MAATLSYTSSKHSLRSARTPLTRQHGRLSTVRVSAAAGSLEPGSVVLVAGATGGVGQLVTAKLLERGFKVRALDRGSGRAAELFKGAGSDLEIVKGDLREASDAARLAEGVQAIACCTGTTAFPSGRWEGNNGPKPTDWIATSNLINASPKSLTRFVFVTSAGVERQDSFPWLILNTFGVLKYKRDSEVLLEKSGLPFTILRPSRLTDGPYTSYDLNTLLKSTAGTRRDVQLSPRDDLLGEASRIAVAEAVVQALLLPQTAGKKYAISSTEGDGPGTTTSKWQALFAACR